MNGGGGGGGGGRRILGPPPRNGRKDRDEDLLLFREMYKREKERTVSLLQPVSDEFEANGGNYPLYRINASTKKESGHEFLAESDKNDYDWLKTPPATPLFPSLEMEANAPELVVQREIPIIQHLSRFSDNSEASKASNGRPKSPNPKPKPRLGSVTPSDQRPSSKGPQTLNQKTTDLSRRSNIMGMIPNESHPNFLTSNLSKNIPTDSKTKPRSRGVSPLVRSTIPAQIPGFSHETPPNLKTDRSSSASRGRPSNPTLTGRQKPESTVKSRRQSCSPSVTRGRKVEGKQESDRNLTKQRGRIQIGNGTQVLGSRMVEKVMNARKSGGEEREAKPKSRGGSINEGSGFGRMMSKSSLDMALKHMEIRRDQNNFRQLGKSSKPTNTAANS